MNCSPRCSETSRRNGRQVSCEIARKRSLRWAIGASRRAEHFVDWVCAKGAIVQKAGIGCGLWAAIGFLTVGPSWAAELHDLVGTWIVESASPAGMIPVTAEFTETGDSLSGQWTVLSNWTEANKVAVSIVVLRGASLSFRIRGWA